MINKNIKILEKYCSDYKNIENYEEALTSPLRYDLHHRCEISESKSKKQLIEENLYYGRPPEELIFLEHGEHQRLHNMNMSTETRKKKADAMKGKQCAMGHHCSAETRQRMSEAKKGIFAGEKNPMFGKHWHLEDGHRIWTD